ncbi:hypothetical protein BGZ74_005950 [Mortierella antarctica]|nr:hypothetical protein BGZ74_005950 [Mortierella antarctica]
MLPCHLLPHLTDTSSKSKSDEDITLTNPLQPPQPNAIIMAYQFSTSTRIVSTNTTKDHPVWTHICNPMVNHELDSLHFIYNTLNDPTASYTATDHQAAINTHIKKCTATICVRGTKGWSSVPESELQ